MKSTVSNQAFYKMVGRMTVSAGRRAAQADPEELRELLSIRDDMDAIIQQTVNGLRDAGFTWDSIGEAIGVTRQACIKRWGNAENKGHRRIM